MSKDVTMRDIAAKLNISAVSVSKAISGKEGVSDSVRELILNTAKEMGYKYTFPGMDKQEHIHVGVIVSQTFISDNAFYTKMFQNIAIEFGKGGHSCTLEIINTDDEKAGRLPVSVESKHQDGLIVMGPIANAFMDKLLSIDVPCVFVDNYSTSESADCVVSDNLYGSHMLTDYLIKKGHRKIAFVGSVTATNSITDRYLGYVKGLMQHGIALRPDYVLEDRYENGILKNIEFPEDMPEAFVVNCDEVAYHLVEQLKERGIKIPEDVSVVGFDDFIFSAICDPPLTTFKVNMEEMSRVAVEMLEDKLRNPSMIHGRKVISGKIVIRNSVREH